MSKLDTSNSSTMSGAASPLALPPLPYAENALEPIITAKTMSFHFALKEIQNAKTRSDAT